MKEPAVSVYRGWFTRLAQRSETPLVFRYATVVRGCKLLKANGAE